MVIKFRAWDKKEKKMIRSPYDADFNVVIVLPDLIQIHSKTKEVNCIKGDYLNKRFVPMLYTGLTDINGKEIYEGDIVRKTNWEDFPQLNIIGQVVMGTRGVKLKEYPDSFLEETGYSLEVIGNVWENPNLLKGGKNATK